MNKLDYDGIMSAVKDVSYTVIGGRLTICVIELQNGFLVTGESAAAHVDNFDKVVGEQIAFDNAFDKIWLLEGYLLKQRLYEAERS